MATYKEIQDYVRINFGYITKSCWIAHCKEIYGLDPKVSLNRHNIGERKHPCPEAKQRDIEQAFQFYQLIE